MRRELRRRAALVPALVACFALLLSAGPAAGRSLRAHPASEPPPSIAAASLTQDGQNLVWRTQLSRPFSAAALERGHTALCLLLERASSGQIASTLCLVPGRNNRPPERLELGGGSVIAATVTRPSTASLSASFLPTSAGLGYQPLRWQVRVQSLSSCLGPCATLSPAQPQLLNVRPVKLVGCVANGPNYVFHGPSNVRDIALTFDDGPWGDPPSIDFVNELARLGVPGTFFEIGDQISQFDRNGAVERKMLANGDMIGDHTWTHPNMLTLSPAAQRSQIAMTAAAIKRATGFQVCLFRAPYGAINRGLLGLVRSMGMTSFQWNNDPRDWSLPGVGSIESTVLSEATNGGIVEMHFGGGPRSETLDALPTIVGSLGRRGYKFVTLTQMMGYRLIYK